MERGVHLAALLARREFDALDQAPDGGGRLVLVAGFGKRLGKTRHLAPVEGGDIGVDVRDVRRDGGEAFVEFVPAGLQLAQPVGHARRHPVGGTTPHGVRPGAGGRAIRPRYARDTGRRARARRLGPELPRSTIRPKADSRPGCTGWPKPPGWGLTVEPDRILRFGPGVELCAAAVLEPWGTLASGTLLAGFAPVRVDAAVHALAGARHIASVIGRAESGTGVVLDGSSPLARFERNELNCLPRIPKSQFFPYTGTIPPYSCVLPTFFCSAANLLISDSEALNALCAFANSEVNLSTSACDPCNFPSAFSKFVFNLLISACNALILLIASSLSALSFVALSFALLKELLANSNSAFSAYR